MNITVSFKELSNFIKRCFEAVNFSEPQALKCANLMAKADLMGQDGHGVFCLPQYVNRIQHGGLNTNPDIKTVENRWDMTLAFLFVKKPSPQVSVCCQARQTWPPNATRCSPVYPTQKHSTKYYTQNPDCSTLNIAAKLLSRCRRCQLKSSPPFLVAPSLPTKSLRIRLN